MASESASSASTWARRRSSLYRSHMILGSYGESPRQGEQRLGASTLASLGARVSSGFGVSVLIAVLDFSQLSQLSCVEQAGHAHIFSAKRKKTTLRLLTDPR